MAPRCDGRRADCKRLPWSKQSDSRYNGLSKFDMPEGRNLYECDLALIHPDQRVAWRGGAPPADCDALLARVTGW